MDLINLLKVLITQMNKQFHSFMQSENPLPCSHLILCSSKRITCTRTTHIRVTTLILSPSLHLLPSDFTFYFTYPFLGFYVRIFCVVRDLSCARYILDAIKCIEYSNMLVVTADQWVIGYRRLGITACTCFKGAKYVLTFRPLRMRPLLCLEKSGTDYQVRRSHNPQKMIPQRQRSLFWESEDFPIQYITCVLQ